MSDDGKWVIAEGLHDDLPLVIRYRKRDDVLDFEKLPHLVRINWVMQSTAGQGMPDAAENLKLNDFEALLQRGIEAPGAGLLAVVVTTGGARDLYLYAADMQVFVDGFHALENEGEPFPISLEVTRHEFGEFYFGIIESCA